MSEPKRLFFALELPSAVQKQIVQWRATHFPEDAGRPVAADNLHLTLAFLGEVSAENSGAGRLAGRLRQPGFTLTLDDAGQWLRSRVVWLEPASRRAACCSSPACCALRRRAAAAIRARSRFTRILPCGAMLARRCRSRPRLSLDISGERVRAL